MALRSLAPVPHSPYHGLRRWLAASGLAAACCIALVNQPAQAQNAPRQKTESPYFHVPNGDPALDLLPLKSTSVSVNISGVIADVTVIQRYKNEGKRTIEANYVFPGSTQAAVHGMEVRLGDRRITARIREKQQAQQEYDNAKRAGKTAALLEQHQPNVFQMHIAHIQPGDDIQVELHYTELLPPRAGSYQFVFPTVVGPRYNSPQSSQAQAGWVAQPVLPAGQASSTTFDLQLALRTPIALQGLASPSHAIQSAAQADGSTLVTLQPGGKPGNNRDFILDYRLAGAQISSGVMLYQGKDENFFLALVEPPKAVPASAIVPREYIFVVDISGSMHGFPLDTAKTLLRALVGPLRPSDSFNVLLFSGSSRFLNPESVPATRANIDQALHLMNETMGAGGTELVPALKRVYATPKSADVSRTVVVVTDGFVTVESELFALVRSHLDQANVFAFGIGSSVNRHLMEGIARAGMGEPFIITQPFEAAAQAERFHQMVKSPVLTGLQARFAGLDVYDVEPEHLPDVLGDRPVVLFGKWRGKPEGQLVLEGRGANGPFHQALPTQTVSDTPALRHLWARHRIASLSDQVGLDGSDTLRQRITDLGLAYSLLTQYTSFIAVDEVVRNAMPHDSTLVKQPMPLPQGVGNLALAVGAEVSSTPEPATWGAVLVLLSVLALLARRQRRQRIQRWTA